MDCLTQPQVNSLKRFYAGGVDAHGNPVFPGYAMGDEEAWGDWIIGHGPGGASGMQYPQNYFRYMVTGDPEMEYFDRRCGCVLAAGHQDDRGRSGFDQSRPERLARSRRQIDYVSRLE